MTGPVETVKPPKSGLDIEARDRALSISDAPAWRPQVGEILTGKVVAVRKGGMHTTFGVYPIVVVERIDGYGFPKMNNAGLEIELDFIAVHAMHFLVKQRLAEIRPIPAKEPILTFKYAGRKLFGQNVKDGQGNNLYVEDPSKADYEVWTVIEGDGSDMVLDDFDWADIKSD